MVLSDVIEDYESFIDLINANSGEDSFITSALSIIERYHDKITQGADLYLKSAKNTEDKDVLARKLRSLESSFPVQLPTFTHALSRIPAPAAGIEKIEFRSPTIRDLAKEICDRLNALMDLINEYVTNKMLEKNNSGTFFAIIDELQEFKNVYIEIVGNYDFLKKTEEELLEKLPEDTKDESCVTILDIRSLKPSNNLAAFSSDLALLTQCFDALERLYKVGSQTSIVTQKIESGSLKGLFASDKVDFTIFPDLISSISNAIKSFRLTPAEKKKIEAETRKLNAEASLAEAEAEKMHIQTEGMRVAIARKQIEFLSDKLQIDVKEHPEMREQMEQFCIPLISYLESNPIGAVNGVPYNLSEHVNLIEEL